MHLQQDTDVYRSLVLPNLAYDFTAIDVRPFFGRPPTTRAAWGHNGEMVGAYKYIAVAMACSKFQTVTCSDVGYRSPNSVCLGFY